MRKKDRGQPLLLPCALSCKKILRPFLEIWDLAVEKVSSLLSLMSNTRLELLALLTSGVTEELLDTRGPFVGPPANLLLLLLKFFNFDIRLIFSNLKNP